MGCGCVGLLVSTLGGWVYDHFKLGLATPNAKYMDYVQPRVCRWIQKHETVTNVDMLGSIRRTLDRLRPSEVTWDPYVNFRENGVVHAMAFYSGTIKYMDVVEPYHPERILRQFGHVQSIPDPPVSSQVLKWLKFRHRWQQCIHISSYQFGTITKKPKKTGSRNLKKIFTEERRFEGGASEDVEIYQDPTTSLYYTNQSVETAVPVLLVDGYNVCGYWPKLKKHFANGNLDIARQKLVDELITFSTLREVKVVAVFDAMMSGLPTHKESFASVDIVFSSDTCADAWIEKEVVALKEDGCPKVWVVTSDHSQQHAAHGAGAYVWSSKALVKEIKASQKEFERMLHEQRSTSVQGKLLRHNLDPEVVDALKDLRTKLSNSE
ncbi:hypothetical protein Scep_027270 [Stephania cephalantha]|uniref:Aminotransferase-like plant mobile domain-containing protein n=1 Tax=Stephania cephalantha TaxID=152367 RepID=A0AAP0EAW6_9MAGN